jgi:hypothetical protein
MADAPQTYGQLKAETGKVAEGTTEVSSSAFLLPSGPVEKTSAAFGLGGTALFIAGAVATLATDGLAAPIIMLAGGASAIGGTVVSAVAQEKRENQQAANMQHYQLTHQFPPP